MPLVILTIILSSVVRTVIVDRNDIKGLRTQLSISGLKKTDAGVVARTLYQPVPPPSKHHTPPIMSLIESAVTLGGAFNSIPVMYVRLSVSICNLLVNYFLASDIGNVSTQEQRGTVAREIRDACINVGFFYGEHAPAFQSRSFRTLAVSGHGIPPTTIDNIFSTMKTYFSLPLETKMKVAIYLIAHFLNS